MKAGKTVTYIDSSKREHDARVRAVVGSGASGYKVLDLEVATRRRTKVHEGVVHERDNEGKGYWK